MYKDNKYGSLTLMPKRLRQNARQPQKKSERTITEVPLTAENMTHKDMFKE